MAWPDPLNLIKLRGVGVVWTNNLLVTIQSHTTCQQLCLLSMAVSLNTQWGIIFPKRTPAST